MIRTFEVKRRKCGWPQEGGVYLRTGTDPSPNGILPPFVEISPPIPYSGPHHRTPVIVDGSRILARLNYEDCLAGTSQKAQEKKEGDAWAMEVFGMPAARRLKVGLCKNCKDPAEALALLAGTIGSIDQGIARALQYIALAGLPNKPRVAEPYAALIQSVQKHQLSPDVDSLIAIQAAVWRLVGVLPPTIRPTVIRHLASILICLYLTEDAMAILEGA